MSASRVNLGEPLRFRVETTMRKALKAYAKALSKNVGHPISMGGAVRDLVARALAVAPDAAYMSGFREGFIAGYADYKSRNKPKEKAAPESPMEPQPPHGNEDYRGDKEGE